MSRLRVFFKKFLPPDSFVQRYEQSTANGVERRQQTHEEGGDEQVEPNNVSSSFVGLVQDASDQLMPQRAA